MTGSAPIIGPRGRCFKVGGLPSWTNQYRLLLTGLAYLLLETMRRTALRGTDLARSQCQRLRLRVLRIGAVVTHNIRTVAVRLSGAYPDQALFRLLVQRLTAG